MLNVIPTYDILVNVNICIIMMPNIIMLDVILVIVIILNVLLLNVIMLNVPFVFFMLNAVPFNDTLITVIIQSSVIHNK